MKFKIGVFQIQYIANSKIYIDSNVNLDKIWNRHIPELNYGMQHKVALQKAWNEFGESNFTFEILSEIQQNNGQNTDYTKESKLLVKCLLKNYNLLAKMGITNPVVCCRQ